MMTRSLHKEKNAYVNMDACLHNHSYYLLYSIISLQIRSLLSTDVGDDAVFECLNTRSPTDRWVINTDYRLNGMQRQSWALRVSLCRLNY